MKDRVLRGDMGQQGNIGHFCFYQFLTSVPPFLFTDASLEHVSNFLAGSYI